MHRIKHKVLRYLILAIMIVCPLFWPILFIFFVASVFRHTFKHGEGETKNGTRGGSPDDIQD